MEIDFDPAKSAKNARERGLPFDMAAELEWRRAIIFTDDRFMYGEERRIAFAPIRERLYAVCYVQRGQVRRVISFRKANKRQERLYAKATADE